MRYITNTRCQAISSAIKEAEAVPDIKCLVLQSSSPSVFSAGLDLAEMLKPEPDRLTRFWRSFQDLYLDLYGSRLACVAAIEGHAMAGGCMLALSCDYRIMASSIDVERPVNIGLNETKLGIAAPPWLGQQMIDTVGRRCAEKSLQLGQIYSSEDALKIGLIDEVVAKENVRSRALEIALTLSNIPERARVASKMLIRKDRIDTMTASRQQDTDDFVGFVTDVSIQNNLAAYFQMLAAKRKKE